MAKYVNKSSLALILMEEYGMKKKDAIRVIDRSLESL